MPDMRIIKSYYKTRDVVPVLSRCWDSVVTTHPTGCPHLTLRAHIELWCGTIHVEQLSRPLLHLGHIGVYCYYKQLDLLTNTAHIAKPINVDRSASSAHVYIGLQYTIR